MQLRVVRLSDCDSVAHQTQAWGADGGGGAAAG